MSYGRIHWSNKYKVFQVFIYVGAKDMLLSSWNCYQDANKALQDYVQQREVK